MRVLFLPNSKMPPACNTVEFVVASPLNTPQLWAELLQRFPRAGAHRPGVRLARNWGIRRPPTPFCRQRRIGTHSASFPAAESFVTWKLKSNSPNGPSRKRFLPTGRPGATGAWLEFRGVVRGEENGQAIHALEYEAYPEMAVREIRRLLQEISSRHPCHAAKVIHRVGVIPVGKPPFTSGSRRRIAAKPSHCSPNSWTGSSRTCRFGNGRRHR